MKGMIRGKEEGRKEGNIEARLEREAWKVFLINKSERIGKG